MTEPEIPGEVVERYVSKPQEVEAIHWTGQNWAECVMWARGKARFTPRPLGGQPEELTLLAGKEGAQDWVPVPVGHWLVRQPDDNSDIWPVDPDYFATKYEPGHAANYAPVEDHDG